MQYFVASQNMGRNNEEWVDYISDFVFERTDIHRQPSKDEKLNPDKNIPE